jgi:hypothetical protein
VCEDERQEMYQTGVCGVKGKLNVVRDSWKLGVDDVVGCIVFALYFILLFHLCLTKKF